MNLQRVDLEGFQLLACLIAALCLSASTSLQFCGLKTWCKRNLTPCIVARAMRGKFDVKNRYRDNYVQHMYISNIQLFARMMVRCCVS